LPSSIHSLEAQNILKQAKQDTDLGNITVGELAQKIRQYPTAFAGEFRAWTLYIIALAGQVADLHNIVNHLEEAVTIAVAWGHHLGEQIPDEKYRQAEGDCNTNISQMGLLVEQRDTENDELRAQVSLLQAQLRASTALTQSSSTYFGSTRTTKFNDAPIFNGNKDDNFEFWYR
jgi:hypothetical protein